MKLGIVGYGTVGTYMHSIFGEIAEEVCIYDKFKAPYDSQCAKDAVNSADAVFIAVPTLKLPSGGCDLSAIEEVVDWLQPPMCIKSTIIPGTTDMLVARTGKRIVFSPEYVGETPYHKYRNQSLAQDLVAIGGDRATAKLFLELYKMALGPQPRYFITEAITAELAKYMENCFFATKVAFVGQFRQLADQFGADFDQVREIWVSDTRVGTSHSAIIDKPGFGGMCLPKDLSAIVTAAAQIGGAPLLEAVMHYNDDLRKYNVGELSFRNSVTSYPVRSGNVN
jgi:UDPglucose 6-dehydrogenase